MNLSHIYEFEKIKNDFIIENDTILRYKGFQKIVYIPIEFGNVVLGKYAFADNSNIEKVICFDNVTEIEMFCFENSPRFKEIYITNKDIIIDEFTFSEGFVTVYAPSKSLIKKCDKKIVQCKKIERNRLCYPKTFHIEGGELKQYSGNSDVVETPYFVTKIKNFAFDGACLKEIIISSNVVLIEPFAFSRCKSLRSIIIMENANITDWNMLSHCHAIRSLVLLNNITSVSKEIIRFFVLVLNR